MKLAPAVILIASLSLQRTQPQHVDCDQRTPEAFHSKSCPDSLVENDSGRIDDLKLPHKPPYDTYSRWIIGGQKYVLAYWDRDNELLNLHADLYYEDLNSTNLSSYSKIATVPSFEVVKRVLTEDLVGDGHEQLVILSETGQLEAIRILQIEGRSARLVLDTAGTKVKIVGKSQSAVLVYAKTPNKTEVFRWSVEQKRFKRIAVRSDPPDGDPDS